MFGIANYVLIVLGLFLIIGSIWDYKVFNPLVWGNTRNKKGIFKTISPYIFKMNKIRYGWDGLLGIIACLLGMYGIINDIHDDDEKNLKDIYNEIVHKKDRKENKHI